MTKVTWIGEGVADPKQIEWGGVTFKRGEAVEVENEMIVEKAKSNKYFKVEGGPKRPEGLSPGPSEASYPLPDNQANPVESVKPVPPSTPAPKFPKI